MEKKIKKQVVETTLIRVSKHSQSMINTIHKIVAVESNGEILGKVRALEVALEEFLDERKDSQL